jgi:hypothetical protein
MSRIVTWRLVIVVGMLLVLQAVAVGLRLDPPVRGKSAAMPLAKTATAAQQLAQSLALDDARVAQHTMGSRAEVLGVRQMSGQYTAASQTCATADCYQVEIYDFDHNATILAIVDIEAEQVRDVLYLPNAQPGVNRRLADRARMLASNHPEIVEALGFRPNSMEVAAPLGGMEGTNCDGRHLCVGLVYHQPGGLLWAIVDLTLEEVAAVLWTDMPPDPRPAVAPFVPESCPAPGTVERDGWSLAYHTTSWDGLRVHDISYNGMPVANNIKLVEWHIRYSSGSGFHRYYRL